MKKIVLMADGYVGLEVAKKIVQQGDQIVRVYLHEKEVGKLSEEIKDASNCADYFHAHSLKDTDHVEGLRSLNADFIITVYWAHLLKPEVISCAKDTVNFHPALLPINRGWYPHVHSILDGSPLGITLHRIDEGADTGPVWAQKKIELSLYDTAKTAYDKLQNEIVELFSDNWSSIRSGEIEPRTQSVDGAIYHKKSEIEKLDHLDLDNIGSAKELITILKARSFGDLGFAYYEDKGKRVYLNLRLSDSTRHA
jgi:methionyl-tRNA formyltransferase